MMKVEMTDKEIELLVAAQLALEAKNALKDARHVLAMARVTAQMYDKAYKKALHRYVRLKRKKKRAP